MADKVVNAKTKITNGKLEMMVPTDINNPDTKKKVFHHLDDLTLDGSWDGFEFEVSPRIRVNHRIAALSHLKTAYLAAFALLGYRYILREELEIVRDQIAKPKEIIIPAYRIRTPLSSEGIRKMIEVKDPIKAIAVQIDPYLVFLPPIGPSNNFYNSLARSTPEHRTSYKFSGVEWAFPNGLELLLDH
jgi:hypothetical protein